jgi:hypothetical protein
MATASKPTSEATSAYIPKHPIVWNGAIKVALSVSRQQFIMLSRRDCDLYFRF